MSSLIHYFFLFFFQPDQTIYSDNFQEKALPLREIISRLENVYCGSIGAEFMHIHNLDQVTRQRGKKFTNHVTKFHLLR